MSVCLLIFIEISITRVILHLIERNINNWKLTPLFFLRNFWNIHEKKMQRGHPFNFSEGGYGYYPLINFHHIAWKTFYTPMTICWGGGHINHPGLSVYKVHGFWLTSYTTWALIFLRYPSLVPKIDHVQPPVTDFFFYKSNTITCWCSKCDVVNIQT